jgi:predicted lipoprotein
LSAIAALVVACDAPVYDRAAILRDAAEHVIVPGYDALDTAATRMEQETAALCAAPSTTTLASARGAWREAFIAFETTSAYQIGPARSMNLTSEMAFWPISPTAIERNVASTDAIDAHYVDALGGASKGLLAIAYLLAGGTPDASWTRPDDAAIAAGLAADARRCTYLHELAAHVARTSATLADAWHPDGGNYVETLAGAGSAGNPDWPDVATALAALFTQMLDALKAAKNTKLGIPIGHRTMMPSPSAVESPYESASIAAIQANVEGVRTLYGAMPHSFDAFLETRDPDLAATVRGELDAASAGVAALGSVVEPDDLHTTFVDYAAGTDHVVGESTYSRIDAAETTMATDVAARLGLSVAFSDMDGD